MYWCVCVTEREKERECVCVYECVCMSERKVMCYTTVILATFGLPLFVWYSAMWKIKNNYEEINEQSRNL